jgi:hypothetical protein
MLAPRLAAAIGAALLALTSPAIAADPANSHKSMSQEIAAACPRLPEVAWWDTTPQKIVEYVDQAFQGDWDPYIAKWESYRTRMNQIRDHNGTAIVKSRGLRLEGDSLVDHIRDIDQRLKVTRCLKDHYGGKYV